MTTSKLRISTFVATMASTFLFASVALAQDAAPPEGEAPAEAAPPEAAPADAPPPMDEAAPAEEVQEEAPAAAPVDVTADFFSRYEVREGYDSLGRVGRRLGEGDGTAYRARVGVGLAPKDVGHGMQVSIFFQPQASGWWGDVSGGLADAALGMHQGKLRLHHGDNWIDVGRFEMVYGEHLVIGNVIWHETGRAFDGARMHMALNQTGSYLDGFATFVREGGALGLADPTGSGDRYFFGLYTGVGSMIAENLELDFYLLGNIAPKTNDGDMPQDFTATEVTLGARAKKNLGMVTVRGEGGVQIGERPGSQADVFAYHIDADAMVKAHDMVTVGLGGLYASGDDPDTVDNEGWNQLYPTAHKFLGFMDIMGGRTNVAAIIAKARVKPPVKNLSLGLDAHLFWRPETDADNMTGFETDGWLGYDLGGGLKARGQYAIFVPNDEGPFGTNDLQHYVELTLAYTR